LVAVSAGEMGVTLCPSRVLSQLSHLFIRFAGFIVFFIGCFSNGVQSTY
jgi:hypothetical protein